MSVSTRIVSYLGAANGCRALPAALGGHLLAAYAFVFVGALGGVLNTWFAFKSVGQETENHIKQFIGKELSEALRQRAPETSASIAATAMQPCMDAIENYSTSFDLELKQVAQAPDFMIDGLHSFGVASIWTDPWHPRDIII